MNTTRARAVVCLAIFAALAAVAGGWIDEPQFDIVSGADWTERVTAIEPAGSQPSAPLVETASPRIASGLILLAAGLIVTVVAFAAHARAQGEVPPGRLLGSR